MKFSIKIFKHIFFYHYHLLIKHSFESRSIPHSVFNY